MKSTGSAGVVQNTSSGNDPWKKYNRNAYNITSDFTYIASEDYGRYKSKECMPPLARFQR